MMIAKKPKPQLNKREEQALLALQDEPAFFACLFRQKKELGILLATKSQLGTIETNTVSVPKGIPKKLDGIFDGIEQTVAVVVGVGNQSEISQLGQELERSTRSHTIILAGFIPSILEQNIADLGEYMNDYFRSADCVPFRVELIIVTFGADGFDIVRMKHDGESHDSFPFCIVGGRRKIRGKSMRQLAILKLSELYTNRKIPSLRKLRTVIQELVEKDPADGFYTDTTLTP